MNSISKWIKRAFVPGRVLRKWILPGLVALLACVAAWGFNHSQVKAEEPDLSLLRAAYARSTLYTQSSSSPVAIPAAAFRVDGSGRKWFFPFNDAYIYPNGASYCGIAPVYLPQGARVTSFFAYVLDNEAAQDINVYLYAKPLGSTTTSTTMAEMSTAGQNTALQTLTDPSIVSPFINNNAYVYHVGVCMWGSNIHQRLYAVKLNFVQFHFLPEIMRH